MLQIIFDVNFPQCVIDELLSRQVTEQSPDKSHIFTEDSIITILINIFEAGRFK